MLAIRQNARRDVCLSIAADLSSHHDSWKKNHDSFHRHPAVCVFLRLVH